MYDLLEMRISWIERYLNLENKVQDESEKPFKHTEYADDRSQQEEIKLPVEMLPPDPEIKAGRIVSWEWVPKPFMESLETFEEIN